MPKKPRRPKITSTNGPLSAMAKAFCREYLVDLNGTAAAIRAGYATRSAPQKAWELLQDPRVQAVVAENMDARATRTEVTADRVLAELAKVAFASMRNFVRIDGEGQPVIDLTATGADDLDALSEVSTETVLESRGRGKEAPPPDVVRKTKIKLHDKLAALQKIGDHIGMFKARDESVANAFADAFKQLISDGSKAPVNKGPAT